MKELFLKDLNGNIASIPINKIKIEDNKLSWYKIEKDQSPINISNWEIIDGPEGTPIQIDEKSITLNLFWNTEIIHEGIPESLVEFKLNHKQPDTFIKNFQYKIIRIKKSLEFFSLNRIKNIREYIIEFQNSQTPEFILIPEAIDVNTYDTFNLRVKFDGIETILVPSDNSWLIFHQKLFQKYYQKRAEIFKTIFESTKSNINKNQKKIKLPPPENLKILAVYVPKSNIRKEEQNKPHNIRIENEELIIEPFIKVEKNWWRWLCGLEPEFTVKVTYFKNISIYWELIPFESTLIAIKEVKPILKKPKNSITKAELNEIIKTGKWKLSDTKIKYDTTQQNFNEKVQFRIPRKNTLEIEDFNSEKLKYKIKNKGPLKIWLCISFIFCLFILAFGILDKIGLINAWLNFSLTKDFYNRIVVILIGLLIGNRIWIKEPHYIWTTTTTTTVVLILSLVVLVAYANLL